MGLALTLNNKIRGFVGVKSNDGHDAGILVVADILKKGGIEVIFGGYDLTVDKFVNAIIQEGVHFAGIGSYNGGHIPFFKAVKNELQKRRYPHIHLIGGGGATITPEDIAVLENLEGIDKIFRAGEGHKIVPFINAHYDFSVVPEDPEAIIADLKNGDPLAISNFINMAEEKARLDAMVHANNRPSIADGASLAKEVLEKSKYYGTHLSALDAEVRKKNSIVFGITGRGGSGKSTIMDELILRFFKDPRTKNKKAAVLSIDPSSASSGGALLADRVAYIYATDKNWVDPSRIYIRSIAARGYGHGIARALPDIVKILKVADFEIFVESYGIGQPDIGVTQVADKSVFVATPDIGGSQQIEKEEMLIVPGVVVVLNKSELPGSRHVSRLLQNKVKNGKTILTTAIQHNNPGVDDLYQLLTQHYN